MRYNSLIFLTLFLLVGIVPRIAADESSAKAGELIDLSAIKMGDNVSETSPADATAQQIYGMNFTDVIQLALKEPKNPVFILSGDASADIATESYTQLRTRFRITHIETGSLAEKANFHIGNALEIIYAPNTITDSARFQSSFQSGDLNLESNISLTSNSIHTTSSPTESSKGGNTYQEKLFERKRYEPLSIKLPDGRIIGISEIINKKPRDLILPNEYLIEPEASECRKIESIKQLLDTTGIRVELQAAYERGLSKKDLWPAYNPLTGDDNLSSVQRYFIESVDRIRKTETGQVAHIDRFQGIRPDNFWLISLWLELTTQYPANSIQFHSITRAGITQWIASVSGKVVFSAVAPSETLYGEALEIKKFRIYDGEPKIEWFLAPEGVLKIWTRINVKRLVKPSGEESDISGKSEPVINSYLVKNHFDALKTNFFLADPSDLQVPDTISENNPILLPSAASRSRVPSVIRSTGAYIVITANLGDEGGIVTYAFAKDFYHDRLATQFKAWRELAKMKGEAQERVNEEIRQINRAYLIHGLRQEGYLP